MKRAYLFLLFLVIGCGTGALAQERIKSFDSVIEMDITGKLVVTETIVIYAEGYRFKRGIFRQLPLYRNDADNRSIHNEIKVLNVIQDGMPATYKESNKQSLLEIRIGSADLLLSEGLHSYVITYSIENQVGFFEQYDELYWNVTGNGWDFMIDSASCTLLLPAAARPLQKQCYTGMKGSTARNCESAETAQSIKFTSQNLMPAEGLTIAVGFTKGVAQPPPPPGFWERYGILILAILFLLTAFFYMLYSWVKVGKDLPAPVVIPRFDVPADLSPAKMAFYYKERYSSDYFTIALVQLAVKGFVKITEKLTTSLFIFKDTTYTIQMLKSEGINSLPEEEKSIMNALFPGAATMITADGKYQSTFSQALNKFAAAFNNDRKSLREGNNLKFLILPFLLLIAFWAIIAIYNVTSVFMSAVAIGVVLFIPVLFSIPVMAFSAALKLKPRWRFVYHVLFVVVSACCIGLLFMLQSSLPFNTKVILLFSLLLAVLFMGYKYLIKRPTEERLQRQADINGFAMYIKAAEEKQLQFFNSPAMTPQLFETLLPFAMALGAEKIWGAKFKKIIEQAILEKTYQPTWYSGTNFSTINFHNIGNDIASTISKSSVAPSISGGGWSSGSGGGGFSGGGGGGGGGGGW